MNQVLYFAIACFLLSFGLTWLVRKWAIHKSIIDHPNERSSHTIPTPRGGGLAIAITWFIGILFLFLTNQLESKLFWALLAGLPLPLIGFLDDIYNLNPGLRSLVQFFSAIAGVLILGGLKFLDLGFITIDWIWILTPLAFVGVVWAINLFNFLDGTDGYCSMEAIFIFVALVFLIRFNPVFAIGIASIAGFLAWNWPKAKIFMGDVGSTLLGYNLAIFAIYFQNTQSLSLIIFLIISSLFWLDATLTLLRRIKNKEKLSVAHRKHAFQRIVQAGFSHQKLLWWQLAINFILLVLAYIAVESKEIILLWLIIAIAFLFGIVKLVDKRKSFEYNK